jgi:sugar lactone lactonase YvrE
VNGLAFSPDGKQLAIDAAYRSELVTLDGEARVKLVEYAGGGRPAYSPDGSLVYLAQSPNEGTRALTAYATRTGEQRSRVDLRTTVHRARVAVPRDGGLFVAVVTWNGLDRARLLVLDGGVLRVVDLPGGAVRAFTGAGRALVGGGTSGAEHHTHLVVSADGRSALTAGGASEDGTPHGSVWLWDLS